MKNQEQPEITDQQPEPRVVKVRRVVSKVEYRTEAATSSAAEGGSGETTGDGEGP
jgi:hypothetical protein